MQAIIDSLKTGFTNYVNFDGKAGRSEYWFWVLGTILVGIALSVIDAIATGGLLYGLFALATIIPSIAFAFRRMHDTGKSAIWLLVALIPLIGWIFLIYLLVQPSK